MSEMDKINAEQQEEVVGGRGNSSADLHNLKNYVTKTVCNVVTYDNDPSSCLTLRVTPGGSIIPNVGWKNGDSIMVHRTYRENGWYLAYHKKSQKYGYVDPYYVR